MMIKEEAMGLRFFRIIYPSLYVKMSIPPVFANANMGKKKKEREMVTLVGQNGKIWHIDLYVKEKSKLFMGGDGWRQFVAANDLQVGYMLVFKYTGNMVFSFRTFDHSNCETACSSTTLPAYQKCLAKKTSKQIHYVYENDSDSNQEPGSTPYSSKKRKDDRIPSKASKRKVTTCTKAGGWFEIIIMPSHLKVSPVCIPVRFRESIGLAAENANVNLRDLTGHTWLVQIYYRKQSNSHYMSGFHKFANANQLKVGDRCIFESMSPEEPKVFQVKIDRSTDGTIENKFACP